MDASTLSKGQSLERTDGRPHNEPGTYKHKETGKVFITAPGEEGVVQADALIDAQKWGGTWERVGDVPSRVELLKMHKANIDILESKKDPAPGTGENFEPAKK
jgi:hypothetical protein